ncbi:MAG: cysteine desulfurase [Lachnospiraceae bacterium]|nr:cysteine desulfurase [Lachnospiraceae bacterium]
MKYEKKIYFDHAATAPLLKEAKAAMEPFLGEDFENPASGYTPAAKCREAVENARGQMAYFMRARPEEIFFTSGGTESDNWAIRGAVELEKKRGNHIITTQIEHPAVLNTCKYLEKQGCRVTYLPVDHRGVVSVEDVKNAITAETVLISVMYANNEVGTIEPVRAIGRVAAAAGILFHVDAVQAFGQISIFPESMGIDLMSISGHKFGGPKGIGALYVNRQVPFGPLIFGGGQESGMRSGTTNVPGIVGMAAAASQWNRNRERWNRSERRIRDYFVRRALKEIPGATLTGSAENRLSGNAHITIPASNGIECIRALDERGIMASTGSACSTGRKKISHVLLAMGYPEEADYAALRFTFGPENTPEEVDEALEVLKSL